MSLEIKPVHLQYAWGLMTLPQKYPDYFYSDASVLFYLFERIDEKATHTKIKQDKDPQIEPSHFGQTVLLYSEYIFPDEDPGSEVEKEVLRKEFQDTFLNLAAWYILPLIQAAKPKLPYMPERWTKAFLNKIQEMDRQSYETYASGVLDFLTNVDSKGWMRPYEEIADKLDKTVQNSLLILVGMFLAAYEEQKDDGLKPLLPSIVEFLENIREVDEIDSENKDNPPS